MSPLIHVKCQEEKSTRSRGEETWSCAGRLREQCRGQHQSLSTTGVSTEQNCWPHIAPGDVPLPGGFAASCAGGKWGLAVSDEDDAVCQKYGLLFLLYHFCCDMLTASRRWAGEKAWHFCGWSSLPRIRVTFTKACPVRSACVCGP